MEYQVARLLYQYRKLAGIREGVYPEYGGNTEFEVYTFFEVCHHLKDWIEKSEGYSQYNNVKDFIDNNQYLSMCTDMCNILKHRMLDRKRCSDQQIGSYKMVSVTTVGPKPECARVSLPKITIATKSGDVCCYDLANNCLQAWASYFNANNIESEINKFQGE